MSTSVASSTSSTNQHVTRHTLQHQDILSQFSSSDLDELTRLLARTKSPKLKCLMGRDLDIARSKFVTKSINESGATTTQTVPPTTNKNSGLLANLFSGFSTTTADNQTKDNGSGGGGGIRIEFVEEEIEVEEEDIEGYIRDNVRGYENKLRSIKGILTDVHETKIREALICCGGDEATALEALLSGGKLPMRPSIPTRKIKKMIKKKVKNTSSSASSQQQQKNEENQLLPDITLHLFNNRTQTTDNESLVNLLNTRKMIISSQIAMEKLAIDKLDKTVQMHRDSHQVLSHLTSGINNIDEDEMTSNRLFLAGEYEAIQNEEFRLFKFKPERTFANEVSHIHFRVAESEFHRLLVNKSSHTVTEVKYIVSPDLIHRFERNRAQMAFEAKKKFKDFKPILAFAPIADDSDDNLLRIAREGYDRNKPINFFYEPSQVSSHIKNGENQKLILSLVLAPHQVNQFTSFTVTNTELVLPYYIVQYSSRLNAQMTYQQPTPAKGLHDEWQTFEHEAKADKFIDDVQKFYQQALLQKDKEVKLGPVDGASKSGTDLWFEKVYKARAEKEGFMLGADEAELPSAVSNVSYEFDVDEDDVENDMPEEDEEGELMEDNDDDLLTDDIDLENLTEEERRMLEEADEDEDDEEMPDSQL